jgi:hypothetical protein
MAKKIPKSKSFSEVLRAHFKCPKLRKTRVRLYQHSQSQARVNNKVEMYVGSLREQNIATMLANDNRFKVMQKKDKRVYDCRLRLSGPHVLQSNTATSLEIKHAAITGNAFSSRIKLFWSSNPAVCRRKQAEMIEQAESGQLPAHLVTLFKKDNTVEHRFFPAKAINSAAQALGLDMFRPINPSANGTGCTATTEFWDMASEHSQAWVEKYGCDISVDACREAWNMVSARDHNQALIEAHKFLESAKPKPLTRQQIKFIQSDEGKRTLERRISVRYDTISRKPVKKSA